MLLFDLVLTYIAVVAACLSCYQAELSSAFHALLLASDILPPCVLSMCWVYGFGFEFGT